ncbi:hypothetical protein [Desulfotruncus arcticus]|nr:hypothetical protein [Desulfotruncus arcticus]
MKKMQHDNQKKKAVALPGWERVRSLMTRLRARWRYEGERR